MLVWPGDIVMGDDDGVVVLPSQLAEEIRSTFADPVDLKGFVLLDAIENLTFDRAEDEVVGLDLFAQNVDIFVAAQFVQAGVLGEEIVL